MSAEALCEGWRDRAKRMHKTKLLLLLVRGGGPASAGGGVSLASESSPSILNCSGKTKLFRKRRIKDRFAETPPLLASEEGSLGGEKLPGCRLFSSRLWEESWDRVAAKRRKKRKTQKSNRVEGDITKNQEPRTKDRTEPQATSPKSGTKEPNKRVSPIPELPSFSQRRGGPALAEHVAP